MIKLLLPIVLTVVMGLVGYKLSAWRLGKQLDARSQPLDDDALRVHVARMAQVLGMPRVNIRVLDDPGLNGLAAPDGRIFLTRGFIEQRRVGKVTVEELASVVAHELGHVDLGHARKRMISYSGQNALRMAAILFLGRLIPVIGPWIAAMIAGLATTAMGAHVSRKDEYQADAFAAGLLAKIGVGSGPQVSLLRKLGQTRGVQVAAPSWLQSHPDIPDRIAAIEAFAARWRNDPA